MKILVSAAAVLSFVTTPAIAREPAVSITVSYDDLNLGNEAGLKEFDQRMRVAVKSICAGPDKDAMARYDRKKCRKALLAKVSAHRSSVLATLDDDGRPAGTEITLSTSPAMMPN